MTSVSTESVVWLAVTTFSIPLPRRVRDVIMKCGEVDVNDIAAINYRGDL